MTLIGRIILSVILFLAIVSGGYAVFQQREMADRFARLQDTETARQIELANEAVRRQVGQMRTMASILGMRDDVRQALQHGSAAPLDAEFANQLGALALGAGVIQTRLATVAGDPVHESAMSGDGRAVLAGDSETIRQAHRASIHSGRPQVHFQCADTCLVLVWAPVLKGGRAVGAVMAVAPLADILLSFYRVAGTEVGLTRRDADGPAPSPIAMTGGDEARQLLSGLPGSWQRSAQTGGEWQQIAAAGKQYRVSRWSSVFESTRLPIDFVALADVTTAHRDMDEALRASVIAALGWMLLASVVVWLLLRRLIARLRCIGDAIRGLETDSGATTRARLDTEAAPGVGDELGQLARVVVDVAQRLDDGEAEMRRQQDELRATLVDLEHARSFIAGLLEAAPVLVLVTDIQGRVTLANRLARELGGWSAGTLLAERLLPDHRDECRADLLTGARQQGGPIRRSAILVGADGEPRNIEWLHCSLLPEADGEPTLLSIGQDVTSLKHAQEEHEQLQRQLQQAHKMEAIGQLAGGIAHDFNNILASIMGYAVLARDRFARDGEDRLGRYLGEILRASERARDLVAQLLAFSRQDVAGNPQRMQLEPLIKELGRMLTPLLPATIALRLNLRPAPAVLANPLQIQQIVMNLAINARDATGGRGTLTVSLGYPADIDAACASCHAFVKGRFVELAIADNGPGIAPEHLTRIFEPFFTTKDPGKGTGMGLAIVHGLVHEGGGHLIVDAAPGGGTVFRVLLPAAEEASAGPGNDGAPQ